MAGVVDQNKQADADETATYIEKVFKQAHDTVVRRAKDRDEVDLPSRARGFLRMKDVQLGAGDTYTLGSWNPKQYPADE